MTERADVCRKIEQVSAKMAAREFCRIMGPVEEAITRARHDLLEAGGLFAVQIDRPIDPKEIEREFAACVAMIVERGLIESIEVPAIVQALQLAAIEWLAGRAEDKGREEDEE